MDGVEGRDRLEASVVALRAEVEHLRAELARKNHALAVLAERLVPLEQARAEGAARECDARIAAEVELRRFRRLTLYRYTFWVRNTSRQAIRLLRRASAAP